MAHNEVFSCLTRKRKYPDYPTIEVFEAAKSGDSVLLSEVLQQMNSSERASALETTMVAERASVFTFEITEVTPLIVSVKNGNLDCVNVLLKYKADIEGRGDHDVNRGCTPLCVSALYGGNLDVLSCLIKNGADVNGRTNDYCTPLIIASKHGHLSVVKFLLDHGADMDLQDENGKTALHYAVDNDRHSCDVLSCLIENGADVNACTNDNCTPLMIASRNGDVIAVTFLIEHGAGMDLQDENGKTALHYAVDNDCDTCDVLSCLIENGADVNACTNENCTPLMIASKHGHLSVVKFLLDHGADMDLQDENGKIALHYAVDNDRHSCDVLSCLIENGADVNACTNDYCTPLMIASRKGDVIAVTFLIEHGADMDLQDKDGKTAVYCNVEFCNEQCDVLSCLIENGADVNVCTNYYCTPLMKASDFAHVNAVTLLVEHGADMDLQDEDGDTALHYAVRAFDNPSDVAHRLLTLGADQLYNNQQLTPLLLASNDFNISLVEDLISRPEFTKEERIEALELIGASLATEKSTGEGFKYMKRGMEERFEDPSRPLLKQPMEPVEVYQNRKESQTLEELTLIKGDVGAILIESLIIKERILGTDSAELHVPISIVADYYSKYHYRYPGNVSISIGLYRHAIKIAQSCNLSAFRDLHKLFFLYENVRSINHPKQNNVLELLEQTVIEYEKQKLRSGREFYSPFHLSMKLVQIIAKVYCEESKTSRVTALLKHVFCLNPRDYHGDTLLHKAVVKNHKTGFFSCLDTVKLLLNAGFNVDAINSNGDTPLHKAVSFTPSSDKTDMLEVLLDGGAHHDFVNNDGKTATDLAETDEVRMILSVKSKLELKCISAKAVKKFGLPYLGVVPKILEKYISMH